MANNRSYGCWFSLIVLTLLVLRIMAREIPNSKSNENQKNNTTTTLFAKNNTDDYNRKDVPKGNEVNNDGKNFIKFGGIGAAGGIGGAVGVVPIGFLDKGLGAGIMPLPLPGGGLGGIGGGTGGLGGGGGGLGGGAGGIGGAGGAAGGGGPGCPTTGGLVRKP